MHVEGTMLMREQCTEAFRMMTSLAKIIHSIFAQWGLNSHHGAVLLNIKMSGQGLTQKALAQNVAVQPSSITSMLDTLERQGLVCRRPDEQDKRVNRIYLTEAGEQLSARFMEQAYALNNRFFEGFSPEDRAQFWQYVYMMRENMLSILAEQTNNKEDCI